MICSCFHPHLLQLILVRYTGVDPNLLKRAHITRGWLTVFMTDAMIQKRPRQTNCIPYYIKQVQLQRLLSVNYTFMVLKKTEKNDTAVDFPSPLWYDTHRDQNTCSQKGCLSWIEHTNSGSIRTGCSASSSQRLSAAAAWSSTITWPRGNTDTRSQRPRFPIPTARRT